MVTFSEEVALELRSEGGGDFPFKKPEESTPGSGHGQCKGPEAGTKY